MEQSPRKPHRRIGALVIVTLGFTVCASSVGAVAPQTGPTEPSGYHWHYGAHGEADVNVCSLAVPAGQASCMARMRTDTAAMQSVPTQTGPTHATEHVIGAAAPSATLGNNGAYDPSYLQSAYNAASATNGTGETVAIVDAFDDPNAAADLAFYRTFFGLAACTTANGCFKKVNESGGTQLPAQSAAWSQEISLDLDMVSAMCPRCKILLVEAASAGVADLGTAVDTAVSLGANAVSNSYGMAEYSGETNDSSAYYDHPGVAIVVASGDNGFGAEFPAASASVTAVGGTTLTQASNTGTRNATETAWSGAGSGCSAFVTKPSWQHDTGCSMRTVADVSAVADPNTGVWAYDTFGFSGFQILGGTSAAAPIVASMYALAANPSSTDTLASYPYAHTSAVNDVTSGSNGTCSPTYLCTAVTGYDGPTGLGTPNTSLAFSPPSAPTPQWALSVPPQGGTTSNFTAVSAIGTNDVWAVGSYTAGGVVWPLTGHWNGTAWTLIAPPQAGTTSNFTGVTAISTNDVWAVGSYTLGGVVWPLTEHWNGTAWSVVVPPQGGTTSTFTGVTAINTNDVWAVGSYTAAGVVWPLTGHWNGTTWTLVVPPQGGATSNFTSVTAVSTNDVWAVGSYTAGGVVWPLTGHWNGTAWTLVVPPQGGTTSNFTSVSAINTNDVWAVGSYTAGGIVWPLTGHY